MAITFVASVTAGPGANGGTTGAIDTTGATLIVISVGWFSGATITVSDSKGNSWAPLTQRTSGTTHERLYACLAPTVGTGHTVTVSGTGIYPAIVVTAFAGVALYQTESGASGTTSPLASGSVTPLQDGALLVTGRVANAAATDTLTGFTTITKAYTASVNMHGAVGYVVQGTAAAINPTWAWTGAPGANAVVTAVFLPTAPTAALTRVQRTPAVATAGSPATTTVLVFGTPPAVGRAIVVVATGNHATTLVTTVTDNYGNTYGLATAQGNASGPRGVAVWFCPAITATGAAFTITVTGSNVPRMGIAIEVSGGGVGLLVDQAVGASTSTAGVSTTGATAALTGDESLVVAAVAVAATVGTLTASIVLPPWTQEAEALTATQSGEIDSRVLVLTAGTTTSATWSWSGAAFAACALVAFKAGAPVALTVPDVVGLTEAAASAAIVAAGFTVGTVTTVLSGAVPAGSVVSQSPLAGSSAAPGTAIDLVLAVAPGLVILINGVEWKFRHDSMSIVSTVNGRDTLSGVIDILDDADPPTLNQELTVEEDGVRIFGGSINELEYRAITSDPDASKDLMVSLSAEDFNALADRRTVTSLTAPEGSTLKDVLVLLVPELASYGVTLSATQVDGPVLPSLNFTLHPVTAILDELSRLTEFVWEIDYYKVLSMWQPGSVAAPFNITDGDQKVWGDIVIRPIASEYANRIIVRGPGNGPSENVFAWYTDGTTNNFPMYMFVLQHFGQVLVDTPLETVPGEGYESVGAPGSGALWEFHDGPRYTQHLSRAAGAPPAGNPWGTVPYPLQFRVIQEQPIVVTADDLAEQAANGIVEKLVESPTGAAWWELQALADSLLVRHKSRRYTVQFSTRETGLRVGQSVTMGIARRNLSGPYFITDVETQMVGATILKRTVTANETELFQGSWRDTYKLWAANSSGGGGGSTTVGTTVPVGGTPVPHHVQHEPGGMDPMTVDSTAAIGSLRTLGTGANQAAPGNVLANYLLRADVDQVVQIGTRAAQPAATAVLAGTLYCVTDDRYEVERSTGTAWETFVRRRHVAIFAYDYSSTTTAPPASTTVRFNAAAPYTAVTKVWLHTQTNDGRDVYLGLIGTDTGARVTIQDKNDHTIYATFTLTGAPVDNTTYIEWPVVYHSNGGASLLNNQAVLVMKQ